MDTPDAQQATISDVRVLPGRITFTMSADMAEKVRQLGFDRVGAEFTKALNDHWLKVCREVYGLADDQNREVPKGIWSKR